MKNILISFILLSIGNITLAQSCVLNGPIAIKSQAVTEFTFKVDGLVDSNLAGIQSVCLVELGFRHKAISTMEVDLISPAGQTLQLIGPASETSLGSTQFVNWDVAFAASNFPPQPDEDFDDVWDSANLWQSFEEYNGRYRPSQGNLEDLNTGSANGTWTIRIQDLGQDGNGVIDYMSLRFCDQTGLVCNSCFANAGFFDEPLSQAFCKDDSILENSNYFTVAGDAASYNNDRYNFAITIANQDELMGFGAEMNLASLGVGSYTICGVINRESDQVEILLIDSLSALRTVFADGSYCGAVMQNCMEINIEEPQSVETIVETVCKGEVITINSLNFYEAIDTTVYSYGAGACESVIRYIIDEIEISSAINSESNLIDCDGTLILEGSTVDGSSYSWTTNSGSFENVSGPIVSINQAGLYFLEVSNENCSDISSIEILPGNGYANSIVLSAEPLGCTNSQVAIDVEIDGEYDSFTWSGPGISDPNQLNPIVDEPGIYTLRVNNSSANCSEVSNSIVIAESNSAVTPLFNNIQVLECNQIIELKIINAINPVEASWTNMNGDTLSTNPFSIDVSEPDEYTYTYVDEFGCEASASIIVEANFSPIEYTVTIDSLSCGDWDRQIYLDITSGNAESYFWIGPARTFFFEEDPEVEFPGKYQLSLTTADGCVTRDTIEIEYDSEAFNFDLSFPKLTCAEPEVEIEVFGPADWAYEWERENDSSFAAPQENTITVDQGGIYFVTITRPSDGCEVQEWTLVQMDTIPADLSFNVEKLDCDTDAVLLESNANGFGITNFIWQGPGINASNEQDIFPEVDIAGTYFISGISANGCEFKDSVIVKENFTEISLALDSTIQTIILDCNDSGQTVLVESTRKGLISWTTPSGIVVGHVLADSLILDIDQVGIYVIDVVASDNGCIDQLSFEVTADPTTVSNFYLDNDGDGFGSAIGGASACTAPPGFVSDNTDCDDSNPDVYPGAPQGQISGIDYNCDGINLIIDNDQDGFDNSVDCDDENPDVNPGATEIPDNLIDDNCDGIIECTDLDQDGFCINEDCDDTNPAINPDAEEIPNNGVDEDCDGGPDVFGVDIDSDGYNDMLDCDDENPEINPGATEIPNNGIDEDCDGMDLIVDALVNLGDIEVNIYPNPVADFMYIESTKTLDMQYEIYTVDGFRVLLTANVGTRSEIDLSNLRQGVYVLMIKNLSNKTKVVYRFVKV